VENLASRRTDDKIRVLNAATQAAVATFHRRLDAVVHDERSYQVAVDLRLSAIEDTQALILGALNTLPNQLAAVFNAQLGANPTAQNPSRAQQQQQQQQNPPPPLDAAVVPPAGKVSFFSCSFILFC
jgi:hypothetical protein